MKLIMDDILLTSDEIVYLFIHYLAVVDRTDIETILSIVNNMCVSANANRLTIYTC